MEHPQDVVENLLFGNSEEQPQEDSQLEEPQYEEQAQDETEVAQDSEEQPEFAEVEFDGQLYDVPVALKDAIMKNADYTQKTQDLARQRDQHDVSVGHLNQQVEQYKFYQQVQPKLAEVGVIDSKIGELNDYLTTNAQKLDPGDFQVVRQQIDQFERQKAEIQNGIQSEAQNFQQAQQQARAELLEKGTEVLKKHIQGWGDEAQQELRKYALGNGFTAQEIDSVVDPKQVLTLWKASQYDALQQGKSKAVQKVKAAPKASRPMPKDVQNDLNLRKKLMNQNLTRAQRRAAAEDLVASKLGL